MRTCLATALLVLTAAVPAWAQMADTKSIRWLDTPVPAPALPFKTASGHEQLLSNYRGQPILLNVWATWCAPCVQEMPSLNRLHELAGGQFYILPLSLDAGPATVAQMYFRLGLTNLPTYLADEKETAQRLGTTQLPISYLINREGKIVALAEGAVDWTAPDVLADMQRFIALAGPGPNIAPSPTAPAHAAPVVIRDVVF